MLSSTADAPRRADEYDTDRHEGRVAAAMDKFAGHDIDGRAFSGSDYAAEP